MTRSIIHSPMNYTGGKFRILPCLLDWFPKDIDCFYDLFCGGLNVSLNAESRSVVANDVNTRLMDIYRLIASFDTFDELEGRIIRTIKEYGLHDTGKKRQECLFDGSDFSVSTVSQSGYENIRNAYNAKKEPLLLLVLVFYSFNNCIRFNTDFKFNMPIGKSCYNPKNSAELRIMHSVVKNREFKFTAQSFDQFKVESFNIGDFVYCDPPYLITDAVYNESNNDESGWSDDDENRLYAFLDDLDSHGIKFGLSNSVSNNGKTNQILYDWMSKYNVLRPDIDYSNSSYQRKNRDSKTDEVYVTNDWGAVDKRIRQESLF